MATAQQQPPKNNTQAAKQEEAKKLTPEELLAEKKARFKKVAGGRATNVVKNLGLIGNCANPNNYSYTDEQRDKLFKAIDNAVAAMKQQFEKSAKVEAKVDL